MSDFQYANIRTAIACLQTTRDEEEGLPSGDALIPSSLDAGPRTPAIPEVKDVLSHVPLHNPVLPNRLSRVVDPRPGMRRNAETYIRGRRRAHRPRLGVEVAVGYDG